MSDEEIEAVEPEEEFDLLKTLTGLDYPETTVDLYFNAVAATERAILETELAEAVPFSQTFQTLPELIREKFKGDYIKQLREDDEVVFAKIEELNAKIRDLDEQIENPKFKARIHLRGVPIKKVELAEAKARREFKIKDRNDDETARKQIDYFTGLSWSLHITKIEYPIGRSYPVSDEIIKTIREEAPTTEVNKVQAAIEKLYQDTSLGFELHRQSPDFS